MAAKILEFRRFESEPGQANVLDGVTIHSSADITSAAQAFEQVVRGLGLKPIVWPQIATMEPMVDANRHALASAVFGWEPEQVERLHNYQLALSAPWLRASRVESQPFWINASGIFTRWRNRYLEEIDLGDFEERGLGQAAIVIPIHMPFGQIAVAAFVADVGGRSDISREFAAHADMLAGLVVRFVQGYHRISRDERYLPTERILTNRQIQCLRWAALGKTDGEIGIILGCSHAGVRYHVSRACESLDAVNRAHSVFRAAQLGYLS